MSPNCGTRTSGGSSRATGSFHDTWPRSAMSASSRAVNTLVIEPISKTVSMSGVRGSSPSSRPRPTTWRSPSRVITAATMPTLRRSASMRSPRMAPITSSSGMLGSFVVAAHRRGVPQARTEAMNTRRRIALPRLRPHQATGGTDGASAPAAGNRSVMAARRKQARPEALPLDAAKG